MLDITCILIFFLIITSFSPSASLMAAYNLTLPGQHPNPEAVALQVHSIVNASLSRLLSTRRKLLSTCETGNPIDDCWRCDTNWQLNRQRLADCGIGFGQYALGGKGGRYYVVTDSSDPDPVNPPPGTLRYGVIQAEPLWIVFASSMLIHLSEELIFNSYKTLDGRGANVHITGGGCITLQYISNVIIHNIHIHHCYQSGETNIRSSPSHFGWRTLSDGDGISIFGSRDIWIDHCSLSHCKDGLIDAVMGSTGITISNNHFSHHNEVMLLGHSDDYLPDSGMQVTIAFNHFGKKLIQRMPRCRRGYIHVVNNDFTRWEMYAIGGSGNPTINSQGNRYIAPFDRNAKEVTKRVDTSEEKWRNWNWRSEGDVLANGAYFVASGEGVEVKYEKAYSVEPKSANFLDQITMNAGVLVGRGSSSGKWTASGNVTGDDDGNYLMAISGDPDDYDGDYAGGYMLCPKSILLYYLLAMLTLMLL
ncbi:probable pectate lyase 12 [Ipomoea triloba]|uniref:probable pectate lyase 12 n=1 Tax=Ipomoea triloba TaxID=35885 RepID=UPI00125D3BC8|nr:probable pectate lyase 12 [Ipomoea triloba]